MGDEKQEIQPDKPNAGLSNDTIFIPASLSDELWTASIVEEEDHWVKFIHQALKAQMIRNGLEKLFPCQVATLREFTPPEFYKISHSDSIRHAILEQQMGCFGGTRDILISAPTGSGKTLAYCLPILNSLYWQNELQEANWLRALIVLPTRDLVMQVKKFITSLIDREKVRINVIEIVGGGKIDDGKNEWMGKAKEEEMINEKRMFDSIQNGAQMVEFVSKCDILVTTPGRLVDHIKSSNALNLHHLQWLVIDEADRLLDQSFNEWIAILFERMNSKKHDTSQFDRAVTVRNSEGSEIQSTLEYLEYNHHEFDPFLDYRNEELAIPVRKLLFSATLSRDPEKLALLNLRNPKFYITAASSSETSPLSTNDTFILPDTLQQHYYVCLRNDEKPILLLYLLQRIKFQAVLCFANSIEHAEKLEKVLRLYYEDRVPIRFYASSLPSHQRIKMLRQFMTGKIKILITTDALSRGVDVSSFDKSFIDDLSSSNYGGEYFEGLTVVHYEIPPSIRTYVHRTGRTARAGKIGHSIAILARHEVRHWKGEMRTHMSMKNVKKGSIDDSQLYESVRGEYETKVLA